MDCCCTTSDGVSPSVYHEKMRRARGVHECCECGRTIERGEQYQYVTGVWDDEWITYKTCLGCMRLRLDVSCGEGWTFGTLREDILDCIGYDYVDDEGEDD